ncbi:MAG TPA: hypothetical protein VEV15_14105, partial [Flavisolibacter sp.]|nr:hypothetical protein [Flavisolibacter sp.]
MQSFFRYGQSKRNCLLIFAAQIFLTICCPAQPKTIDSLKKGLSGLTDTPRVDCLNQLSYQYILAEKKDIALHYASLAYQESKQSNYIHGIAESLSLQSQIAKHFDDDFIQSEVLGKESLRWYEQTANKKGIDNLYSYLIYTVFSQSRFDEAISYTEKEYAFAKQNSN